MQRKHFDSTNTLSLQPVVEGHKISYSELKNMTLCKKVKANVCLNSKFIIKKINVALLRFRTINPTLSGKLLNLTSSAKNNM